MERIQEMVRDMRKADKDVCGKLEIRNLSKSYGRIQALDGVTMSFHNGIYGLLGPNGAGKSTLINLLTDNLKRQTGEILWEGTDILTLGRRYRDILGYMPQQQGYYEEYTAAAFLIYMGQMKGMSRKAAVKKAEELLEVVNLGGHKRERIGGFSGGMRQRLLLAQAMMNDPKLEILEEPTAGVDPQERIRIRNFISEIAEERVVLLATHIVSDVESVAREIILMKQGKVVQQDRPSAFLEKLQGKVFEIEIQKEALREIEQTYVVSNLRSTPDGLAARIVADEPPEGFRSTPVLPNLEDVYLVLTA